MTSAWLSSFEDQRFDTAERCGKISVNNRSRNVRSTVRIWSSAITVRPIWVPV